MYSTKISPNPCLYVSRFTAHSIDDRVEVPQYFQTDSQCNPVSAALSRDFPIFVPAQAINKIFQLTRCTSLP